MNKFIAIALGTLLSCAPAAMAQQVAPAVTSTAGLVQAMQQRYGKSWYHTLTFTQETKRVSPEGKESVDIWDEAGLFPGKLRIDYEPIKDGNGVVFVGSKLYVMRGGKVESTHDRTNPLLFLGFDLYFLPEAEIMKTLADLKVDTSVFRTDTWQGRPSYVVGAKAGDLHSAQFWIDKENLYFTRFISPAGKDDKQTQEYQFNKYIKSGGGWVGSQVLGFLDGKNNFSEEYDHIKTGMPLDPKIFDPASYSTTRWEK